MSLTRTGILLCACALATSIVGASQAQGTKEDGWRAPSGAASVENPLANRPDTLAGGRKLFNERCAFCHGEDGSGTSRGPNLTTGPVQSQSDGELFWKISGGNTRTGMPGFSFLPRLQRWQLVKHVRALAH